MAACEECWSSSYAIARRTGRPQAEVYHELIEASPRSHDQPQACKHCDDRIAITPASSDFVHIEGWQQGKHTCAVDPYGFHAEPVDAPCGDNPANPCNGARGIEVRN